MMMVEIVKYVNMLEDYKLCFSYLVLLSDGIPK